jgi:SNF2 family DNA or RNA helicase
MSRDWQRVLDHAIQTPLTVTPEKASTKVTPLALQVRLNGLVRNQKQRQTKAPRLLEIAVRPVLLNSETGNWVGGGPGISWDQLRRESSARSGFDPVAREWLAELAAMRRQGQWGAPDWTKLADFPGRLVWNQLALGQQLEVPLVAEAKRDVVLLAKSAALTLDISKDDDDFIVAPVLTIDGQATSAEVKGAAGYRGVFTAHAPRPSNGVAGWNITLAPTAELLTQSAITFLNQSEPLRIPASDSKEFLASYLPKLRRDLQIVSSNSTFKLPESPKPTLVITATFTSPTTAQLTTLWEYHPSETDKVTFDVSAALRSPLRDTNAEQVIWRDLKLALAAANLGDLPVSQDLGFTDFDAMRLSEEILPVLRKITGVSVVVIGQPHFTELTEQPIIELAARESSHADWFDLAVTVKVGEAEVPLPNIMKALAEGRKRLMLVDGSWLRLDHPALERLRVLIGEADRVSDRRGKLVLSRHQAALWDELAEVADVVEQSERWRSSVTGLLQALKDPEAQFATEVTLPNSMMAELRPYQVHGFRWLHFIWKHQLGGILADDMGLGKTLQALALMQHAVDQREDPAEGHPFLVVAPASVVDNWAREAARFTPDLKVRTLTRVPRTESEFQAAYQGADVVVTSYAIFRLDDERLNRHRWAGLILDEAQFIKNRTTKANQVARRLVAPFKLALTGTPLENNVHELWALLAVVAPGLFPTYEKFRQDFARPIEALHRPDVGSRAADDEGRKVKAVSEEQVLAHGRERMAQLRRRVAPLLLRRTKAQVTPELPPRIEQVIGIELDPAHREVYDIHLTRERKRVLQLLDDNEDRGVNRVAVFRALMTMRRMALDASLIEPEDYAEIPSSKLEALFEQLESVVAEGHRALIFSQFPSYLTKVTTRAEQLGLPYAYLDGSTRNRPQVISDFKNGSAPLFFISLKAGGFGLNLTEADYVFILDPWWNPAVESQAIDRTHRIGQDKPVNVIRLVSNDTIEEKVMALKARKADLVSSVLRDDLRESGGDGLDDEAAIGMSITADDIKSLLS